MRDLLIITKTHENFPGLHPKIGEESTIEKVQMSAGEKEEFGPKHISTTHVRSMYRLLLL